MRPEYRHVFDRGLESPESVGCPCSVDAYVKLSFLALSAKLRSLRTDLARTDRACTTRHETVPRVDKVFFPPPPFSGIYGVFLHSSGEAYAPFTALIRPPSYVTYPLSTHDPLSTNIHRYRDGATVQAVAVVSLCNTAFIRAFMAFLRSYLASDA